jgi:hypothetical protein
MVASAALEFRQRRKDDSWGVGPSRPLTGLFKIIPTADGLVGAVLGTNNAAIELIDLQDGRQFALGP